MVKEVSIMKNIKLKVFHNNGKFVTFISAEDDDATVTHIISDKVGELTDNYISVDPENIPAIHHLSISNNVVSILEGENATQADAQEQADFELNEVRILRNQKLSETDWWASSDRTMTVEQKEYRQALRDLTKNATSLSDAVFPNKPDE
jgi:magnesium-transporting ATPase (P-type)